MILTNEQILNIYEGLNNLKSSPSISLPASVTYAIIRNLKLLEPIVTDIMAMRYDIITNCGGILSFDSTYYSIPPDKTEEANQQLNALAQVENPIDLVVFPLKILDGYDLTIEAMDALFPIIKEDEII